MTAKRDRHHGDIWADPLTPEWSKMYGHIKDDQEANYRVRGLAFHLSRPLMARRIAEEARARLKGKRRVSEVERKLARALVEHWDDPDARWEAQMRILKEAGDCDLCFICSSPLHGWDTCEYVPDELRRLAPELDTGKEAA